MKKTSPALLVCLLLTAPAAQAQFSYATNADAGTLTLTGYAGADAAVAVPAAVSGLPVTGIGDSAFAGASLNTVAIPAGVTSIGVAAFENCYSLAGVSIPASVTNIGASAFENCYSLGGVEIPGGVAGIGVYAFYACVSLTNAAIANGVADIGGGAFAWCSSLTNVTIPASVTRIGDEVFYGCSGLTAIAVDAQNLFYSSANGVLFDKSQSLLVEYPGGLAESYSIPAGVTRIGDYAFNGSGLAGVTIPGGVAGIGDYAFASCYGLTNVTLPDSVASIGDFAFNGTGLTSVTIPGGVTYIGDSAFASCYSLTNVTIDGGVTSTGDRAFDSCPSLAGVTIPASVTRIGDFAFAGSGLAGVTIPGSVTSIGDFAFAEIAGLTNVIIPDSVTSIGDFAFNGSGLTSVTISSGLARIGDFVFAGTSLTNVVIPGGVTSIGDFAFAGTGLTTVAIPPSVTNIGDGAFNDTGLTSVYFQGNAPVVGSEASLYDYDVTLYYLPGAIGFGSTFGGHPTVMGNAAGAPPVITTQPVGQTVEAGGSARLQSAASGVGALTYQWRFDGAKLADGSHVSGATTNALTLKNVTTANAGSYMLVVTSSFGSVTSAVATVSVVVPPAITTQPAAVSPPPGGMAAFSVKASGAPLAYRWLFNNAPLSDNANISGSAGNKLTINLVASSNAGSYSVIVSNSAASVTSKVARLALSVETTKPTVAIVSPALNSRTNAPALRGTAWDGVRVLNVKYWVTNVNNGVTTTVNGLAALSAGTGVSSNWTIQTPLLPGTNILAVQSSNYSGLASPVASHAFFYQVKTPFQLLVSPAGMGAVAGVAAVRGDAPPTNKAALYVGEGYTLTAGPAANWWLTNWLENSRVAGTNTTLTFIMESNLAVTANFATNLFVRMAARYDGIFYPSDAQGATEATSGLIENLLLKTNGVYSGKIYLAGTNYTLIGAFDRAGNATETIARTAALGGNVTLRLNIPWQSAPRQITGSVQGINLGGWISSNLFLCAATTNTGNFPACTMLLPQDPDLPGSPPNYGYAQITNTGSMIVLGGVLSDGAPFSRSEPINEAIQFPVYASLYNYTGLLLGRLSLAAATFGAVPAGNLIWIKPRQHTGLYTNGFDAGLAVEGSPWTNSASALAGLFPNGAQLTLSGGGLASNLVCGVQLTSSNTLRLLSGSTNFTSGSINRTNGLLTLSFRDTAGKKVTAYGTVLQNTHQGGGFFLGATNAGTIQLQP